MTLISLDISEKHQIFSLFVAMKVLRVKSQIQKTTTNITIAELP